MLNNEYNACMNDDSHCFQVAIILLADERTSYRSIPNCPEKKLQFKEKYFDVGKMTLSNHLVRNIVIYI